jgi:flap endonuclease-1
LSFYEMGMGVAIRDILLEYRQIADWEWLAGDVAVDAHNALYQFLSIIRQPDGTPLMDRDGRVTSHLSGLFFRTINFIEKGIRPVYIFDGTPPAFKSDTIELRRAVRQEAGERWKEALRVGDTEEAYKQARSSSKVDAAVIESSKELLVHMGIPFVDAPSEGEAQAAFMAARGDVRYAVSQDYDSLLFGTPLLVRNLTISGKRKVRGRTVTLVPERIALPDVLAGLGIGREELIEIGLLIGTDYNTGIRGVGAKTALKIVKNGNFADKLQEKLPDFDPEPIRRFFLEPPVRSDYRLAWQPPDAERVTAMLCEGYDFSPDRVGAALEKLSVKSGQKTLDQWF